MLGQRVSLDTPLYSGGAIITHIVEGEMFPFQVKLDHENESGGFTYRVKREEFTLLQDVSNDSKPNYNHPIPARQVYHLYDHWDVVSYNGEYLVSKPSETPITSLYTFEGLARGKFLKTLVKLIGPYSDYKDNMENLIDLETSPEVAVIEFTEKVFKKRKKKEKQSIGEQLSLF